MGSVCYTGGNFGNIITEFNEDHFPLLKLNIRRHQEFDDLFLTLKKIQNRSLLYMNLELNDPEII